MTSVQTWSNTAILVKLDLTSATAGAATVQVSNNDDAGVNTSAAGFFTVNPAPTFTSATPNYAGQGTNNKSISIAGNNFGNTQGVVTFGASGISVTGYTSWNNTGITLTINVASNATSGAGSITIYNSSNQGQATFAGVFTVNGAPTFTNTNPSSRGQGSTGQTVTVNGGNFGNSTGTITFSNGVMVSSITSWSSTAITVVLDCSSATSGAATVTVVNGDNGGQTTSASGFFTVNPAPTFTSINPTSRGQGATSQTLTLVGGNFGTNQGTVTFNATGVSVTGYASWNNSQVVMTVSFGTNAATGSCPLIVVNGDNAGVATFNNDFTVNPKPSFIAATPSSSGQGATGQSVTITGNNFGATQGSISFSNSINVTSINSWSNSAINVILDLTNATTGGATATVTNNTDKGVATSSNSLFAVNSAPSFTGISPASRGQGAQAQSVTITGNNFGTTQGTVTFSATGVSVVSYGTWTNTSIQVTLNVAATATLGACNVTVVNGTDGGQGTDNGAFTVNAKPSFTSTTPNSRGQGATNQNVTIAGANFGLTNGTVTFNNGILVNSIASWGSGSITVNIDCSSATVGNATVTVLNNDDKGTATSASGLFIVNAPPSFTSINPATRGQGAQNQTLTLNGNHFGNSQGSVTFSATGVSVTSYSNWSNNQVQLVVNVGSSAAAGACNIVVVNGDDAGVSTFTGDFTVDSKPSFIAVSPSSLGAGATGEYVTVTGNNFGTLTGSVSFSNTINVTAINSWSNGSILVTLDCSSATGGAATVMVTNGNDAGVATSGTNLFTINAPPSFSSINPTSRGQGATNQTITLSGNYFGGSQGIVTFSATGISVTGYTSWSATQVVMTVNISSSTPQGQCNVAVQNLVDGGKATFNNVFTVNSAPSFTSTTPSSRGQGATGQTVVIAGNNFGNTQGTINFSNGIVVSNVVSWASGSITVSLNCASATAGPATVTILNNDDKGQATSASGFFTVNPAPTFGVISPNNLGQGAANQTVTINGNNFGTIQGTVTFSALGISVTSYTGWGNTAIILKVNIASGATPGAGDIAVVKGSDMGQATDSGAFTVDPAPTFNTCVPSSRGLGATAQSVTITGNNFGTSTGSVTFSNGINNVIATWSNTQILTIVDCTGATVGPATVSIVNNDNQGQATSASGFFTVNGLPTFTSLQPGDLGQGAIAQTLTLKGASFGGTQGTIAFSAAGVSVTGYSSWSDTQIIFMVTIAGNATQGLSSLTLTRGSDGAKTTFSNVFTVDAAPSFTGTNPPDRGAGNNNQTVVLSGNYFGLTNGTVSMSNGINVTGVNSWGMNSISLNLDLTSAVIGTATVTVVNNDNAGRATSSGIFTVDPAPTFNNLNYNARGQGTSNQTIIMTGNNFGSSIGTVTFSASGVSVTSYSSWGNTQISMVINIASNATLGAGDITVLNNDNQGKARFTGVFTVDGKPTFISIYPADRGVGATAQSVTITGSNFGNGTGTVSFSNGIVAVVSSWTNTSINVTMDCSSATAGPATVTVHNFDDGGQNTSASGFFTVDPAPTFTSVNPSDRGQGGVGQLITINGSNFGTNVGTVTFGASGISITSYPAWGNNQIQLVANLNSTATLGLGSITIYDSSDASRATFSGVFTVDPAPTLSSINPASRGVGSTGQAITIQGSDFGTSTGQVAFSNGAVVSSITSWSPAQIQLTLDSSSATAGQATVTVTSGDNGGAVTSALGFFTLNPPPTFTSLSPSSRGQGITNQLMRLIGNNFGNNQGTVSFSANGISVTSYTSWGSTEIDMIVNVAQNAALGAGNVTVVNPTDASQSTFVNVFTVNAKPTLTSAFPASLGQGAMGQSVTITGIPFGSDSDHLSTLTFSNNISSVIDTWINTYVLATLNCAAALTGPATVTLYNSDDASVVTSAPGFFTINLPPSYSGMNPANRGQGAQNQTITLNGNNFGIYQGQVIFANTGVSVTGYNSWNNDQIVLTANLTTSATVGTSDITIVNGADFGRTTVSSVFTVNNGPSFISVSPNNRGVGAVNQTVVITGSNFSNTQGSLSFSNGVMVSSITSWADNSITAVLNLSGATAGPASITVINGANAGQITSGLGFFTVNGAPTLSGISPANRGQGAQNQTITLSGINFGNTQGQVVFASAGISVTGYTSWGNGSVVITVNIDPNATQGANNVTIIKGDDAGQAVLVNQFMVDPKPLFITCSPSAKGIGCTAQSVTITGSYFGVTNTCTITFSNGVSNTIAQRTDSSILVLVDCTAATTGQATISIVNNDDAGRNTSSLGFFNIDPAPTFTSMNPNNYGQGAQNRTITINGGNFGTNQGAVIFGASGISVTGYSSWNSTQIVLTVNIAQTATQGLGSITVINGSDSGQSTFANKFTVNAKPTFTSALPSSRGYGSSGQQVTINGGNFGVANGSISFSNGVVVSNVNSWGTGAITVTLDLTGATPGAATVTVTNGDDAGQATSASGFFTVNGAPIFSSVNPTNRGQGAPNQTITLNGNNFGNTQGTVVFGASGVSVSGYSSWNNNQIVLMANFGSSANTGLGSITVTNGTDNGIATFANVFTVNPKPSFVSCAPGNLGIGSSGQTVVIGGSNFGTTQGTINFSNGVVVSAVNNWSANSVSVTLDLTNATAGASTVTIINNDDQGRATSYAGFFTVDGPPAFTSMNPSDRGQGALNQTITITGSGYSNTQGTVIFGAANVSVTSYTSWSDTQIVLKANILNTATLGLGNLTVINGADSGQSLFPNKFTVDPKPSFTSANPSSRGIGATNQSVVISGSHFGNATGSITVTNGIVSNISSWSDTSITVSMDLSNATAGNVTITVTNGDNAGLWSTAGIFTVNPAPSFTSVNPSDRGQGASSQTITINGNNFGNSQGSVTFSASGVSVTGYSNWGMTQIVLTATIGSSAATGLGNITVVNGSDAGQTLFTNKFTVDPKPSFITCAPPSRGIGSTGQQVIIGGSNFGTTQGTINFSNGVVVSSVNSWSDTSVTVTLNLASATAGAATGDHYQQRQRGPGDLGGRVLHGQRSADLYQYDPERPRPGGTGADPHDQREQFQHDPGYGDLQQSGHQRHRLHQLGGCSDRPDGQYQQRGHARGRQYHGHQRGQCRTDHLYQRVHGGQPPQLYQRQSAQPRYRGDQPNRHYQRG